VDRVFESQLAEIIGSIQTDNLARVDSILQIQRHSLEAQMGALWARITGEASPSLPRSPKISEVDITLEDHAAKLGWLKAGDNAHSSMYFSHKAVVLADITRSESLLCELRGRWTGPVKPSDAAWIMVDGLVVNFIYEMSDSGDWRAFGIINQQATRDTGHTVIEFARRNAEQGRVDGYLVSKILLNGVSNILAPSGARPNSWTALSGFHGIETDDWGTAFRWLSGRGIAMFDNRGRNRMLTMAGPFSLNETAVQSISVNGLTLANIVRRHREIDGRWHCVIEVPSDDPQDALLVGISAAACQPSPDDNRMLSIALSDVRPTTTT
jgi:hypothetical protein